jgi:quercetin 2,3-dioxygenase
MKTIIKSDSRGLTKTNWLTSFHSFSFGDYFDQSRINFGALRVINDDIIEAGGGFPTHPHKNMEIITIVLKGELAHQDSTGIKKVIRYGEVQKMSAGKGIFHSEFNNSDTELVHLLQIWIVPDKQNIEPSYEQINFTTEQISNTLFNIAGNKIGSPVFINQEAELFLSEFEKNKSLTYPVSTERQVYIHVISGKIGIDNEIFGSGDALGISGQTQIGMEFLEPSRFILFNLSI